jgi:hypothetical protein
LRYWASNCDRGPRGDVSLSPVPPPFSPSHLERLTGLRKEFRLTKNSSLSGLSRIRYKAVMDGLKAVPFKEFGFSAGAAKAKIFVGASCPSNAYIFRILDNSGRGALLQSDGMAQLLVDVLAENGQKRRFLLHDFVIMPNHFHLLLTPAADISQEKAVQFSL